MDLLPQAIIKFLGIEEDRGANQLLEFNLQRLRYLGIWKWDIPHWKIHRAFAFLTIIALVLFNITEICDAYLNLTNIDYLTKLLLSIVFVSLLTFKNIYLLLVTDEAHDIIDMLQNRFFTVERPPTSEQVTILNKYAARAKFYTIIRSNMAFSVMIFWLLYPIKEMLGEYADKMEFLENEDIVTSNINQTFSFHLPFIAYSPFDVEHNFISFVLTYIFQAFCGFSVFAGMPAWDMLFVSIFIHTAGHFKALQYVLFHLHEEATQNCLLNKISLCHTTAISSELNSIKVWIMEEDILNNFIQEELTESNRVGGLKAMQLFATKQRLNEEMCHKLNNCIQHHQTILSFVKKLESLLKPVMLMQLMSSMVAFCVIGFQMSVIPIHTESTKFVKLLFSMLSALIEQGMFYWFGGELLEESAQTLNAAYHCKWYSSSKEFRQHLNLLMERAKRPVKLTAGGFSPLTLESFALVIHSSYSYFTMLKAVHDEDN